MMRIAFVLWLMFTVCACNQVPDQPPLDTGRKHAIPVTPDTTSGQNFFYPVPSLQADQELIRPY